MFCIIIVIIITHVCIYVCFVYGCLFYKCMFVIAVSMHVFMYVLTELMNERVIQLCTR